MFYITAARLLERQIKLKLPSAVKANFLFLESNLLGAANGNDHNGPDADDLMMIMLMMYRAPAAHSCLISETSRATAPPCGREGKVMLRENDVTKCVPPAATLFDLSVFNILFENLNETQQVEDEPSFVLMLQRFSFYFLRGQVTQ